MASPPRRELPLSRRSGTFEISLSRNTTAAVHRRSWWASVGWLTDVVFVLRDGSGRSARRDAPVQWIIGTELTLDSRRMNDILGCRPATTPISG